MKVLFAAPEDAWGGIFARHQAALPEFEWQALGHYDLTRLTGVDVLIPTMSPVSAEVLATADRLQLIQQMGAGLEGVDIDAAKARGVAVANVPTDISGNADSVAELAIYQMLALIRQARHIPQLMQQRQLGQPLGGTLKGATVGLIGVGGIGQALARRLRAFETTLVGVKRHPDAALAETLGMAWCDEMSRLDELLAVSDFVVMSLPDVAETHHLMNAQTLAKMKPGSYLINVGRGGLVEPEALLQALRHGPLAGAGLDVFWEEPPDPEHPLFQENIVATPHIGGVTQLSINGIFAAVCDNLRRLQQGDKVLNRWC